MIGTEQDKTSRFFCHEILFKNRTIILANSLNSIANTARWHESTTVFIIGSQLRRSRPPANMTKDGQRCSFIFTDSENETELFVTGSARPASKRPENYPWLLSPRVARPHLFLQCCMRDVRMSAYAYVYINFPRQCKGFFGFWLTLSCPCPASSVRFEDL